MTIPLWAYAAAGSLLTGTLAGWTVRDWKADSDALEAENKAHAQFVAMSQALADQSLQLEYTQQELRNGERRDRETIREIYRDKVVSADCAVPDAAVSLLDNAVGRANAAAAGKPSGEVSGAP